MNEPNNAFTTKYDNQWENIGIKINGKEIIHNDSDIKYLHIKSSTFYREVSRELKQKKIEIRMNQNIEKIKHQRRARHYIK